MGKPTLEIKKRNGTYIHINKISPKDNFRKRIYTEGYRYEIASNTFGTTHHKTLSSAKKHAGKLMTRGKR
jgi:hypothetical protein